MYQHNFIKVVSCMLCVCLSATLCAQNAAGKDSLLNAQLFQTIRTGDAVKLEALLKSGANANARTEGYTALMAAALNGNAEEMKVLLQHGANVNDYNADSISALWLAVPDMEKTKLLISNGANVSWQSKEKCTVLLKLVSIPGSAELMQLLISKGCDPRKAAADNDLMYFAAMSCDTSIVGLLLRSGLKANDTASFGDYPVNAATNYRCFNTLKMLVDNGANVNVSPKTAFLPLFIGVTPLMWAAVSNDKPSFYYLLDHGADAKAVTPGGYTPLMFLAMSEDDDPAMTKALIEHGALPTAKAKDETDALFHARKKGNTQSATMLAQYVSKQ
ncbi:MAG: ankyrin repeat domain-containing protein [Chitinophagaceae bacterium]